MPSTSTNANLLDFTLGDIRQAEQSMNGGMSFNEYKSSLRGGDDAAAKSRRSTSRAGNGTRESEGGETRKDDKVGPEALHPEADEEATPGGKREAGRSQRRHVNRGVQRHSVPMGQSFQENGGYHEAHKANTIPPQMPYAQQYPYGPCAAADYYNMNMNYDASAHNAAQYPSGSMHMYAVPQAPSRALS